MKYFVVVEFQHHPKEDEITQANKLRNLSYLVLVCLIAGRILSLQDFGALGERDCSNWCVSYTDVCILFSVGLQLIHLLCI